MSIPIIEYIAQNIEATVNLITVAAGFNQDLTAVRPKRIDFSDVQPETGKVLIVQTNDKIPENERVGPAHWEQRFDLMALVIDSDAETESVDTRCNQIRADIEKKIMADHTRSTYANNTILRGAAMFKNDRGFEGITVFIDVNYSVQYDDPYTKI